MRIKLTRQEMAAVDQAAALRWQLARASGVANQKRAGESDDDLDKLGLKAEMAVSKCLCLTYSPQSLGIDNGIDMWFGDVGIDVKATFHPSGKLLFKSLEAFKADAAILVTKTDEADVMDVMDTKYDYTSIDSRGYARPLSYQKASEARENNAKAIERRLQLTKVEFTEIK
jgi:hypothetical protein